MSYSVFLLLCRRFLANATQRKQFRQGALILQRFSLLKYDASGNSPLLLTS